MSGETEPFGEQPFVYRNFLGQEIWQPLNQHIFESPVILPIARTQKGLGFLDIPVNQMHIYIPDDDTLRRIFMTGRANFQMVVDSEALKRMHNSDYVRINRGDEVVFQSIALLKSSRERAVPDWFVIDPFNRSA